LSRTTGELLFLGAIRAISTTDSLLLLLLALDQSSRVPSTRLSPLILVRAVFEIEIFRSHRLSSSTENRFTVSPFQRFNVSTPSSRGVKRVTSPQKRRKRRVPLAKGKAKVRRLFSRRVPAVRSVSPSPTRETMPRKDLERRAFAPSPISYRS